MPLHDWAGLELRHLIALQAVAEERSFGRAAERLGYTQSAVSHQIAALEGLVGERVVERGRGQRSVELTQAGALLARHADAIVARLRAAQADYAAFTEGAAGVLRVGIYQSVGTRILDVRDRQAQLQHEANVERLASLAVVRRTSLRIRLAHGLRALAVRIEPAACLSSKPALAAE